MFQRSLISAQPVRVLGAVVLTFLLNGCAGFLSGGSTQEVRYLCDNDRQFVMRFFPGAEGAEVEFNHMHFKLRHESSDTGRRYVCDVMTFSEQAGLAELVLDGDPVYRNCRPAQ